ncbi:hypothetical protein OCO53_25455 [Peribacillus frigoritolerans]|uniref:hypothetical protein n=1 Tax=Peribacillus frigoritolerans TaxID=450367 RepID=UPI0021D3B61B|nr:hypothetical protein [Peribacillus frigoritolerans]MCU6603790.1 hypothetical protein [Peribacillus frigoritolerans]
MNLDRFSQPMSWEWNDHSSMLIDGEPEHENVVKCACGCGKTIDLVDFTSFVESVVWEDIFISSDAACVKRFKANEKGIALQSNPLK